jgi:hypothetical protein
LLFQSLQPKPWHRDCERSDPGRKNTACPLGVLGFHVTAHEDVQAPAAFRGVVRKLLPPLGPNRAIRRKVVADNKETPVTL